MDKRTFLTLLGLAPIAAVAKESNSLLSKPAGGWLPIETAPQDQVVMIYADKGNQAEHNQKFGVGKFVCSWTSKIDKTTIYVFDIGQYIEADGSITRRCMNASHWMPLPEPPKESES